MDYRRIYPKNGALLFDGGKNDKFERSIIEDNESPDCLNVKFSNGAVETRGGTSKLNTAAVGSFVGDGLFTRRARDNTETMVAAWGGSFWQLAGTSFTTIASSQSLFTAGVKFGASEAENYLFVGNGTVIPYKWNGTEFTRHGVYPPATAPVAASASTGAALASGASYTYKVTYVNSNLVESDLSSLAITHVVTANSMGNVALTSLPVAPQSWGVNARYLYRTENGGAAFKRLAAINDNTTTTYDDGIVDASLGAAAPTDNGVPPKYNTLIYLNGRLFMNDVDNPGLVWWTEVDNPYTVASTNFFKVGNNTSDLVRGFAIWEGNLVVFCEQSITISFQPSSDDTEWKWVVAKSPYGTRSPYCILNTEGKVLFAAIERGKFVGFAQIIGDTVAPTATLLTVATAGSDRVSDKIETEMSEVQEGSIAQVVGIVYKSRAYIGVPYGTGATTNNRYYTYDYSISNLSKSQRFSWVPNSGPKPGYFTIYGGNLYYQAADAVGFVYQMETSTYNDDGAAIDSYYWTKEYPGYADEINFQKDFRYANFLVETSGAYFMNLTYRADSDAGGGDTQAIDLNPGGSLWGTMVWGRDLWGGGRDQVEFRQALGTTRGKRIQFKFSNQNAVDQKFKAYRMNFAYNRKGFR